MLAIDSPRCTIYADDATPTLTRISADSVILGAVKISVSVRVRAEDAADVETSSVIAGSLQRTLQICETAVIESQNAERDALDEQLPHHLRSATWHARNGAQ